MGSKNGREEAWKFFKENAAEFKERYGSHHSNARLIAVIIMILILFFSYNSNCLLYFLVHHFRFRLR